MRKNIKKEGGCILEGRHKKTTHNIVSLDKARRSRSKSRPRPIQTSPTSKKKKKTESVKEFKRGMAISRSTSFVAGLFFVFILVYLVQNIIIFTTRPEIPVEMVTMGSVDLIELIEGIIIRDETVYTATRDGIVHFNAREFERIQPGSLVASIQNAQAVNSARQSIYQVEEQIMRLQDVRGELSAVDPAVQQINRQIQNMIDSRLGNHIHLNMIEVYALRDSINQNVSIRNQMIITENLDSDLRMELGINHRMLMDTLDENMQAIYINGGGILSPVVDGLENYLDFQNMYWLSREQTQQNIDFDQLIPLREVAYGDDVFKIINSNIWYIAAYIPNDLVEGFNVGSNHTIHVEGRKALNTRIHHMERGFQESFVIFRSSAYMIDFLDTRSIFFRTTDTLQHGLRIANSAITLQDHLAIPLSTVHDEDGRYVIQYLGEEYARIPIAVIDQNDYYAFILANHEVLSVGSTLLEADGTTRMITHIQAIKGIFRVNTGIAAFTPINLPEDAAIGGMYSILDPILNPGIRVHDHIVSNATLVEDGDIVFSGVR